MTICRFEKAQAKEKDQACFALVQGYALPNQKSLRDTGAMEKGIFYLMLGIILMVISLAVVCPLIYIRR